MRKDCRTPHTGNLEQPSRELQGPPEQAQLNDVIPKEVGFNAEEQHDLEGMLMLFHSRVRALFDTGASRSFIAVRVMHDLGLVPPKCLRQS